MKGHLLAVDVGNTQTAIGLYAGDVLTERWHMATRVARTSDELWVFLRQFAEASGIALDTLSGVSISSVVPELTMAYAQMSAVRLQLPPLIIRAETVRGLRIQYDPPSSVGADRLCGSVAAFKKFGGPLVVVDLGTATVFDVVTADATYLGGLIAPGVATAIESLHSRAALLPRIEPVFPKDLIGSNTVAAIQSGILHGTVDMVNGLLSRITGKLDGSVTVVATGGFAGLLQPYCPKVQYVEPDLVLDGIRLITEEQ